MSSPTKSSHRWGCGVCLSDIPPSYMAQFQVSKRMMFGAESKGLTRDSKRELVVSRILLSLTKGQTAIQTATGKDPVFCSAEEFADGNGNGPTLRSVICRRCFEFAFMIPATTFDDCLNTVLDQNPALATKFASLRKTSPPSTPATPQGAGLAGSSGSLSSLLSPGAVPSSSSRLGNPTAPGNDGNESSSKMKYGKHKTSRDENEGDCFPGLSSLLPGASSSSDAAVSPVKQQPASAPAPQAKTAAVLSPPAPPAPLPQQQSGSGGDASESTPLLAKEKTTSDVIFDFIINGPPPASKTKVPFEWWHAWDVAANTKEIFVRQREGDMAFLDGIRALAYMWVLGDHLYQAFTQEITGFVAWWSALGLAGNEYQIISNSNKGDQGVTSFFFLSGFLIPFVFTRMVKAATKDSVANDTPLPAFSFHAWEFLFRRYMRLAPTLYAGTLVAFLYGYSMKDVSDSANKVFYATCQQYWWQNIFFINNFSGIAGWQDCYDSVWTISVEYQLYILTIPVVYFYCWKEHYGWWAAALWTAITFFIRVGVTVWCDNTGAAFGAWVYLPSWTRAPEYGVGIISFMLYDYYYGNSKRRAEIKPLLQLPTAEERAWRVAFHTFNFGVLAWGLYYLVSDSDWWVFSYNQYEAFSYFLWAGTLFVVAQIVFDNAFWPIRWVLSWYVWYPIAQLAYTAGVLNMVICHGLASLLIETTGFDSWATSTSIIAYAIVFLTSLLLSLMFGFILSLLVERPAMVLAKHVPPFYKLFGPVKSIEIHTGGTA